jgi:nicotinate phosphoribosyltransferase
VRKKLGWTKTNLAELCAFASFARAFPKQFIMLADTYSVLSSGLRNFLCVAITLNGLNYKEGLVIRIDSGDLMELPAKILN